MEEIRNRVSESKSLVVFDLEDYFPPAGISEFDLAPMLDNGVMREKKCRDFFAKMDPSIFRDQLVTFFAQKRQYYLNGFGQWPPIQLLKKLCMSLLAAKTKPFRLIMPSDYLGSIGQISRGKKYC